MIQISDELHNKLRSGEKSGFEELAGLIAQSVLQSIPVVVSTLTKRAASMQKVWKDFYDANPELEKHQGIVAKVVEKADIENPGKDYSAILEIARPKIYESINQAERLRSGNATPSDVIDLDKKLRGIGEL